MPPANEHLLFPPRDPDGKMIIREFTAGVRSLRDRYALIAFVRCCTNPEIAEYIHQKTGFPTSKRTLLDHVAKKFLPRLYAYVKDLDRFRAFALKNGLPGNPDLDIRNAVFCFLREDLDIRDPLAIEVDGQVRDA